MVIVLLIFLSPFPLQAVIENVQLKQQIFSELENVCDPHCILATNTSTIDLVLMGEKTKSQDRIVGAHFFRYTDIMHRLFDSICSQESNYITVIRSFICYINA